MNSILQTGLASLPLLVLAAGVAGGIYVFTQSMYRLFWHPLARFPGPKIAALTKWYEFYFDIIKGHGGQFAWEITRMHEKYGPIVRINPDEVHILDPEWFEVLYAGNPTKRDKYEPAARMAGSPLGTFGTVDHDTHRKRRLANSALLSTKAVQNAEPIMKDALEVLCDQMKMSYNLNQIFELRVRLLAFTTDLIWQHALGTSRELQKNPELAMQWSTTIRAVASVTPLVKQFPWAIGAVLSLPLKVTQFFIPDLARLVDFHRDMAFHAGRYFNGIHGEKKQPPVQAHLFQSITDSSLPPSEKIPMRLAHEAVVVIAAASETSSKILTFIMYHVLANSDVLEKLMVEIMQVMPDANEIPPVRDLENLRYLTAVIREVLRITGVITSRTPLQAPTELTYKQWRIPAKTPVSMTTRDILLNPDIFEEPLKYKPERWLVENPPPERYFVPFSKGTRMCQGVKFAYSELYMVITVLLRRFEFALHDTNYDRDVHIVRDCFVGEPHPKSPGVRLRIVKVRP